jgi:hypothetical protein
MNGVAHQEGLLQSWTTGTIFPNERSAGGNGRKQYGDRNSSTIFRNSITVLDQITVLVITSPIVSHPSTAIIEETLDSIRHHLPQSQIRILADGVRPEQSKALAAHYAEYLRRLRKLCSEKYEPAQVITFDSFHHQVGMARVGIKTVHTPLVFWSEHDTPLVTDADKPIPMQAIARAIYRGDVEFIRFLPEPQINEAHLHLMCGMMDALNIPLMRTIQFSARPAVASKDFYERALGTFSAGACAFLEDGLYTHIVSSPWELWRNAIYLPDGNAQRSRHLDGRAGAPKWDEAQVF